MSRLVQTGGLTPPIPATGKVNTHADLDKRIRALDSAGILKLLEAANRYNYIRNSGFWFAQRQAPATLTTYSNTSGRAFTADGWAVTNENASATFQRVDQSSSATAGLLSRFSGEFTKITSAGKIIVSQAIEGSQCQGLRGRNVRLQIWAKQVKTSYTWKMALLYLTQAGTVDSLPATFVSAFGGATVNPTFGTNLTIAPHKTNSLSDGGSAIAAGVMSFVTTATWTRYGFVATLPSDFKNLIAVVWSDSQLAATDGIALSACGLFDGEEIQDWQNGDYTTELERVCRYYQKTFDIDILPAQNVGVSNGALQTTVGKAAATALAGWFQWRFFPVMRATPTMTYFSPGAASAQARRISGAASADQTATATNYNFPTNVDVSFTGDAAGTVGDRVVLHATADAEF